MGAISASESAGGRVAIEEERKVVGTVTTVRYQDHFSWIGMVLVDPVFRKMGIGRHLLNESLQILEAERTVKLDATPAGREIYLKLDFVDEYPLSRMLCMEISGEKLPPSKARTVRAEDFSRILEFDYRVFGADRKEVLEWSWKNSPTVAFITEDGNAITGFCFGRPGHNYTHIGPVIAKDIEQAIQLVSAALHCCLQHPVIIDSAHHSPAWMAWLSSIGFVEQRPFIRMYKGTNDWPGLPEKQFAILGPEFG